MNQPITEETALQLARALQEHSEALKNHEARLMQHDETLRDQAAAERGLSEALAILPGAMGASISAALQPLTHIERALSEHSATQAAYMRALHEHASAIGTMGNIVSAFTQAVHQMPRGY